MSNSAEVSQEPQFAVQRIYLKDLSFETHNTPKIFTEEWQPELNLELHTNSNEIEPGVYEVILTVTVTVKNKDKPAFLVEVAQAGIFTLHGFPTEQIEPLLGSFCPNLLFPYAREVVTCEVNRGSFPQLILAPVNFDALFMQQKAQSATETPA